MSLLYKLFLFINVAISSFAQTDVCKEGLYGDNCELTCSDTCRPFQTFPCDKKSGQCSEGCKGGYYGDQCDKKCSCASIVCYQANGECIESDETTASTTKHKSDNAGSTTEVPAHIPVCDPGVLAVWRVIGVICICLTIVLLGIGIIVYVRRRMKKSTVKASDTSHRRFPGTFCFPCFGARNNGSQTLSEEVTLKAANEQPLLEGVVVESAEQGENTEQQDPIGSLDGTKQKGKEKDPEHGKRPPPPQQTERERKLGMEIDHLKKQVEDQREDNEKLKSANLEFKKMSEDKEILTKRISELEQQHNKTLEDLGLPTDSKSFWRNIKKSDPSGWFQCPDLKFNKEKINVNVAHIDDKMILWNNPDERNPDESRNDNRFQNFYGTTCTEPLVKTGFYQYFEAVFNITLQQVFAEGEIVMQLGFCGENDRDEDKFTKGKVNCFVLKAHGCNKHHKICLVSVHHTKTNHIQELMNNTADSSCVVTIGIRLNKEFKRLKVYDLKVPKLLEKTDNNIGETIWPMFGLCDQTKAFASVKLKTGYDIEMTKDKKDTIGPYKW